jgi:hypothetical protein
MGEKKRKEAQVASWKKVVVVAACVIFVFLMIVSGMGYGWLSMFSSVKSGQAVQISYTLYDGAGYPILTSDQNVYANTIQSGRTILGAEQITLIANGSLPIEYYPVQAYIPTTGQVATFGLTATEFDTISAALVGMKTNEQKTITIPPTSELEKFNSVEELKESGIGLANVTTGDILGMTVYGYTEINPAPNSTAQAYLRLGEITRKTDGGIVVDGNYPRADIQVIAFGNAN